MVFAGTALALATAGLGYVALVHGVSAARLREGRRGWDAVVTVTGRCRGCIFWKLLEYSIEFA